MSVDATTIRGLSSALIEYVSQVPLNNWDEIRAARETLSPDGRWWTTVRLCTKHEDPVFGGFPPLKKSETFHSPVLEETAMKIRKIFSLQNAAVIPLNNSSPFIRSVLCPMGPTLHAPRYQGPLASVLDEALETRIQRNKERMAVQCAAMDPALDRASLLEKIRLDPDTLAKEGGELADDPELFLEAMRVKIQSEDDTEALVNWTHIPDSLLNKEFILKVLAMSSAEQHAANWHSAINGSAVTLSVASDLPESWNDDGEFVQAATECNVPAHWFSKKKMDLFSCPKWPVSKHPQRMLYYTVDELGQ